MRIETATLEHITEITTIYNDAVLTTTAVWIDSPVGIADRRAWFEDRQRLAFPVLVALDEHDAVVGYATFGPWRPHEGYRHTVEHSVYVRGDQRGRGVGRMLMVALIDLARGAGIHAMIGAITSDNVASLRLHESLGFEHGGTLRQVGAKFGQWLDLALLQLILDEAPAPLH